MIALFFLSDVFCVLRSKNHNPLASGHGLTDSTIQTTALCADLPESFASDPRPRQVKAPSPPPKSHVALFLS